MKLVRICLLTARWRLRRELQKYFGFLDLMKQSRLIEATGTYSDTITLPDGGNYIGIECENFTGNIELNIE